MTQEPGGRTDECASCKQQVSDPHGLLHLRPYCDPCWQRMAAPENDEQPASSGDSSMTQPWALNKTIWWVGKDDGSTGFDVILEQTDGAFYSLFRVEPGGDATAIGMMVGNLNLALAVGAKWIFTPNRPEGS